ncbi:hypothetical protein F5Y10DRAFT_229138 [Nemania abortiva]|nr:hypothetical protein F5Y10DRAFT_229138 [Nemania abortiva]
MGFLSRVRTKKSSASDLPRVYTFSSDSFTIATMSTSSCSTNDSRPTSRHYDTGFPDSFASCTTSMRHPDAVIDPGFAISSEHIDPAKSLNRSRKSLLRKHRRTISHGKIKEGSFGQIYTESSSSALSAADIIDGLVDQKSHDAGAGVVQASKAGAEITASKAGILGISPGFQYTDDREPHDEEERRNKILRKLMNKS